MASLFITYRTSSSSICVMQIARKVHFTGLQLWESVVEWFRVLVQTVQSEHVIDFLQISTRGMMSEIV